MAAMDDRERSHYLVAEVRRHEPERFLTSLFAPSERRDAMLALILLDHELARIPARLREPMAGLIRHQWWRDAVDEMVRGEPPRSHPAATALDRLVRADRSAATLLHGLIDAQEQRLPLRDTAAQPVEQLAVETGRLLQRLIYRSLGGRDDAQEQAAADIGAGFNLVTTAMEAVDPAGRRQRLDEAEALLTRGRHAAGRPPRQVIAAFLPAALARMHLRRLRRPGLDRKGPLLPARAARAPLTLLLRFATRRP
jgi:phytoene synthase